MELSGGGGSVGAYNSWQQGARYVSCYRRMQGPLAWPGITEERLFCGSQELRGGVKYLARPCAASFAAAKVFCGNLASRIFYV